MSSSGDVVVYARWLKITICIALLLVGFGLAVSFGINTGVCRESGGFVSISVSEGFDKQHLYAITSDGECFASVDSAKTWKYCGNIMFGRFDSQR